MIFIRNLPDWNEYDWDIKDVTDMGNADIRSSTETIDSKALEEQGWKILSYNPSVIIKFYYLDGNTHSLLLRESLECSKRIWELLSKK